MNDPFRKEAIATADLTPSQQLRRSESELAPNRFARRALFWVLLTILLACLMNEAGIFEVDRTLIWGCFLAATGAYLCTRELVRRDKTAGHPATKYVILSVALLLTLMVTVFLNINVMLFVLFPLLLSTQYRSLQLTWFAVIGSVACCVAYPLLSWAMGSWSQDILLGYLETACRVSVAQLGAPSYTDAQSVVNILLYICLPQSIIISVFGCIFLSISRTAIQGLNDRVRVMELSETLDRELAHVTTMQDQVLYAMADMVENRDVGTGGHIKRTRGVVGLIVEAMRRNPQLGLTDDFCSNVVKASPLHDLGKIAVDDAILRKPGPLNAEETAIIRQHAVKSAQLIRTVLGELEDPDFIRVAENLALYHHEWYNGAGYPQGLRGEDIPLEARIMAIADVYDALVSRRSYKEAMSPQAAYDTIISLMGTQFDPALEPYFTSVRAGIEAFYAE